MELEELVKKARGGRVLASGFLDPGEQQRLRELARREGMELAWFGGLSAAERRLGVLHPPEVPRVDDPTLAAWLPAEDPEQAAARLRRLLPAGELGDLRIEADGVLFATTAAAAGRLRREGFSLADPPERLAGRSRTRTLVVPSLRVDVVGAKGFGISRSYFAKGVKAGKVRLGGRIASSKDEVREGDVLLAEGLGRVTLVRVLGRTKKGNYKVELTAER
ncbi:S4 domain-containing protein [Oceanithermus sp.]